MIIAPPLETGAVKETVALVWPVWVAVPIVGGFGAVAAEVVTELEEDEAVDVPTLFVAVTVKV